MSRGLLDCVLSNDFLDNYNWLKEEENAISVARGEVGKDGEKADPTITGQAGFGESERSSEFSCGKDEDKTADELVSEPTANSRQTMDD